MWATVRDIFDNAYKLGSIGTLGKNALYSDSRCVRYTLPGYNA